MLTKFKTQNKVIGLKQSRKAVKSGLATLAIIARDAEPRVTQPFEALCREFAVPIEYTDTCEALGAACEIAVGAAVVTVLSNTDTDQV